MFEKAAGKRSFRLVLLLTLSTVVLFGVRAFEAHMAAMGGQIEPNNLSKLMGTCIGDIPYKARLRNKCRILPKWLVLSLY